MKNAGMAGAVALVGIGLLSIGLSNFANRAEAVPSAVVNAGPDEPTIVWYGMADVSTAGCASDNRFTPFYRVARAWSDGTVEVKLVIQSPNANCEPNEICPWQVISSPNEGLNAAADINHDEIVNAADIGLLVAAWGDAPRNPMPPSDCPLGLIP
ncbi:hypothetical protein OAF82_00070 [bacterium]|nr:hypothetical protein [bacterium]